MMTMTMEIGLKLLITLYHSHYHQRNIRVPGIILYRILVHIAYIGIQKKKLQTIIGVRGGCVVALCTSQKKYLALNSD